MKFCFEVQSLLPQKTSEERPPPPPGTQLQRTLTSLRDGKATEEAPLADLLRKPSREKSLERSRAAAENQEQAERLLSDVRALLNFNFLDNIF